MVLANVWFSLTARLRVTGNAEQGLTWTDRRGRPLGYWTEAELARAAQEALGRRVGLAGLGGASG